ncbi:flavodoxin family protein [Actinomyces glycerinitolerans]|uniref:Flavodoxin/nitric oxide synthase n=1 Tax=Actinomyces glycerinitolerans TaxID=1892869 RepID=A0A1M4S1E0_9ACTO|nr:flavodoxin family protein [Actinomyces glycerinitolerans]SHE25960.1 flavodoxin/nitric oxide synthase [Actinomyces glycerinitolerans]
MATAPTALIVIESCFGNTRTIAEAVAAGLTDAGAQARVLDAVQAPASLPAKLDLLILGAPTHNRGLPTTATRTQAGKQAGAAAPNSGMREWLARTTIPAVLTTAVFDTVTSKSWLSGSAAKAIIKALRRGRGRDAPSIRSFLVQGQSGPLADGEEAAARTWGRALAASTTNV